MKNIEQIEYKVTKTITNDELEEIKIFYNSLDCIAIEQFPGWYSIIKPNLEVAYFIAKINGSIVCYAQIIEKNRKYFNTASIEFGPLFKDPDVLINSIIELHRIYTNCGFIHLKIQLGFKTGAIADYVEYNLNKLIYINSKYDMFNWSSIILDLDKKADDLFANFSKGHRSAIRKGSKIGLYVEQMNNSELNDLIDIYIDMRRSRGFNVSINDLKSELNALEKFIDDNQAGSIMVVKDINNQIIGGIFIIYQGDTIRYYKGCADPKLRNMPILHLVIYEAIKIHQNMGFRYFDLWGYNHMVDKNHQIFGINIFKKGFGGDFIFYPKLINIIIKPIRYSMFNLLKKLFNK